MTFLRTLALSSALSLAIVACQNSAGTSDVAADAKSGDIFRVDEIPHAQLPGNVVPQSYRIDMKMDPDADTMSGTVWIKVNIKKPTTKIWLHGKHMTVNNAIIAYSKSDDRFPITFTELPAAEAPSGIAYLTSSAGVLPAGEATISLDYETPFNQALNSAYQVKRGGEGYIVTQFEPLGAREAFPSFDEPKYKVPFTLSITAPESDFVYANTPEIGTSTTAEGWIKHDFATTRPLPTYLVAFGAGPYDVNDFGDIPPNSVRKTPLAQRGITAKGSGDEIAFGLKGTEAILTALEEYFGTPYPYEKLDIIAAPEYAFGAMENPGAIVYREYLLLLDEDAPLSQKRSYARVHAHELAHQWFGNLVTPVWWEDIWLNEAFATWMGNKSLTLWKPDGDFDRVTLNASLEAMHLDSLAGTRKVREPLSRSENVMDQFDAITYRKGGGVLSMFESYLGEDAFQKGVRLHMERYADGVATGDDFFKSIAEGSGNPDVVSAMKSFVDQPGLPRISGELACWQDESTFVEFTQARYAPLGSKVKSHVDPDMGNGGWEIPVCLKYSRAGEVKKMCYLHNSTRQRTTLSKACNVDWIMPNSDGAAYYRFNVYAKNPDTLPKDISVLNTREQLSALDSLQASYDAGQLESADYVEWLETFAISPQYDVASSAASAISALRNVLPAPDNKDFARLITDSFGARYNAIKGQDTVEDNLLSPTLAALLTGPGADEKLQAEFAAKGAKYLGLDGKVNKKAAAQNMLSRALREVAKARPEQAKSALLSIVKSGSAFEKGAALGALGSITDADIAAQLREAALSDTDGMTGRQAGSLIAVMMSNDAVQGDTWEWLKLNFDEFATTRIADVRRPGMPNYARFCSLEKRDEAEAFFKSKAALMPGYERNLAQSLERIELCAALRSAKGEELASALKSR